MTRLELIGILIIVALALGLVGRLIWEQLRMLARRPDRDTGDIGVLHPRQIEAYVSEQHAVARPIMANYSSGASAWPPVPADELPGGGPEPVRDAVRHMLEGGPDYRG